ncbi:MAG: hypothetical protein WKH64_15465 [Chloroflexia bacterium]
MLVEDFIPGVEVALEGLLTGGSPRCSPSSTSWTLSTARTSRGRYTLAPSRLPEDVQASVASCTALAASALGLREGRYTLSFG